MGEGAPDTRSLPADVAGAPGGGDGADSTALASDRLWARALLPIAGALILLLGICGIAAFLGVASRHEFAVAVHEAAIDEAAAEVRHAMLDAETSQRGYLVTDRDPYLTPYRASVAAVAAALDRLDQLLQGDPQRGAIVHALRGKIADKIKEMSRTIDFVHAGRKDAALDLVNADVGLQLSSEIKRLIVGLQNDVRDRRAMATARQVHAVRLLLLAIAIAAVGAILSAGVAVAGLTRNVRLLRRRESQLDLLVRTLESRVASRTRELADANRRFAIATTSAGITVFSQDTELKYLWVSQAFRHLQPAEIIGRTDSELLPASAVAQLDRAKRGVIESGQSDELELRVDGSTGPAWYDLSLIPNVDEAGRVIGLIGGAVDITQRKQSEAQIRLLMRELAHRSKNLLTVVQALTRQTVVNAVSPQDFSDRFSARLQALASSYDLLIKDDWHGTTIEELVWSQLSHYVDRDGTQIEASGPALYVAVDATQNLGMALHELATNAAKYGALSVPGGQVKVHWRVEAAADGGRNCTMEWQESGGPPVEPPPRRGFGQVVIERTVARALNGTVTLSYDPAGLNWTLTFPLQDLAIPARS